MSENNNRWYPYEPTWLVKLAQEQHPDEPWLARALSQCILYQKESRAYFHFVSADRPNQQGSAWQFVQNIWLYDRVEGHLVLDILTNQRVGGIEFLKNIS